MRSALFIMLAAVHLGACSDPAADPLPTGDGGSLTDGGVGAGGGASDGGDGGAGGAGGDPDPHPLGMDMPAFAFEDLNPNSVTYGQTVDSADLLGAPYALIFLDSRCTLCPDVADDIWAAYQAHPTWWDAQPTYGVERAEALATAPETVAAVVEGNGLPYLADTEQTNLWFIMKALNHDFFAVSAEGKLDAWLPLYLWPEDEPKFIQHMTDRYGP
ncbi:MAG: hypothetical protein JRI68_06575 [Deltaproteobacteria bacterium]|nr:hypothetical protein [Deltaproteobacteria bacterium]